MNSSPFFLAHGYNETLEVLIENIELVTRPLSSMGAHKQTIINRFKSSIVGHINP
jgi:hypothetical protein